MAISHDQYNINFVLCQVNALLIIESFRFEDEDEGLCFHHNEIFKLFRLQLGRDDEVDCNNIVPA